MSDSTFLLLLAPSYAFALLVHEGGHVVVGVLCGVQVRLARVGRGPMLLRGRIGETAFELRILPIDGMAYPYPALIASPSRNVAFYAGGALANAVIIGLIALLASPEETPSYILDPLGPFVWMQLLFVLVTLLPLRKGDSKTDGALILRTLLKPRPGVTAAGRDYAAMAAQYDPAWRLTRSAASSRIAYQLARRAPESDRRDACEALMRELARGHLPPAEEMLILDALVTQGAAYGDPALRPRLDEWSQRALRLGPENGTLRGSRGAALVELGRYQEGKALLAPLVAGPPSLDALFSQIFLARAEHKLGDESEARRLLQMARATLGADPSHPYVAALLARVEVEIG